MSREKSKKIEDKLESFKILAEEFERSCDPSTEIIITFRMIPRVLSAFSDMLSIYKNEFLPTLESMSKKERLEDLGVARERLSALIESSEDALFEHCDSKHGYDAFCDKMGKEDGLYDHHTHLRFFRERLWEVMEVLQGDIEGH